MSNPCLEFFPNMRSDRDSTGFWLQSVTRYPLLPQEVIIKLGNVIQDSSVTDQKRKKAVDKLVLHNLRLIPRIVRNCTESKKSFSYGQSTCEDLFQVGVFGLKRAAELYDPKLGYKFSTYANMWILQAVQREINKNLSSIRIPESALRDYYKSMDNKTREQALADICADPRLYDVHNALNTLCSDQKVSGHKGGDSCLSSFFSVEGDTLEVRDTFEEIVKISKLTSMELKMLKLTCIHDMPVSHAARTVGLSRERGRTMHKRALKKVKLALAC